MDKKIFFLVIISLSLISACQMQPSTPQERCESAGGEWREFPNSCVDSCEYRKNPEDMMCAQVLTMGCDCGEGLCWNENECEQI